MPLMHPIVFTVFVLVFVVLEYFTGSIEKALQKQQVQSRQPTIILYHEYKGDNGTECYRIIKDKDGRVLEFIPCNTDAKLI